MVRSSQNDQRIGRNSKSEFAFKQNKTVGYYFNDRLSVEAETWGDALYQQFPLFHPVQDRHGTRCCETEYIFEKHSEKRTQSNINKPRRSRTMNELMKPLGCLKNGERGTVMNLAGGREFQNRMISMGINPGCEIEVLKNRSRSKGPVLTAVGDTRIMIGHEMTKKIMVEVDDPTA